jgi:hypothetical protein
MQTFQVQVKMPNGQLVKVQTQAQDRNAARLIFEAQYGRDKVVGSPQNVG